MGRGLYLADMEPGNVHACSLVVLKLRSELAPERCIIKRKMPQYRDITAGIQLLVQLMGRSCYCGNTGN